MKTLRETQKEILDSLNAMPSHKSGSAWHADRREALAKVSRQIREEEAGRDAGYRYAQLTSEQREAAQVFAERDGRPNCIGLRFFLNEAGAVTGFRDTTPHIPHGIHAAA